MIADMRPQPTLSDIREHLTAPGQRFEMETADIRGVPTRVWKNAPANLRVLVEASRGHGTREFVVHGAERVTYDAHFRAVAQLADRLVTGGVGRGDRVALAMRNLPEWTALFFAVASIGAIAVPLNAWWSAEELAFGVRDCAARWLFLDGERHERMRAVAGGLTGVERIFVTRPVGPVDGPALPFDHLLPLPDDWAALPDRPLPTPGAPIAADDDVAIFYTSGTTGVPKGAVGTHRNLATNILSSGYAAARTAMRRGMSPPAGPVPKIALLAIPLFHVTACSASLMNTVASGGTLVLMPKWDAGAALALIERERVQVTGGVPAVAWQLIEHPDRERYDLSSLEMLQYGGAPAAPELVRRIAGLGITPGIGWGMTETMATVTLHHADDYLTRPDSCGPAVAVADLKIMSPDGTRPLPPGEVGELWARGPMVVNGYWGRPADTAATFIDGWVRTGDLARLDAEGFCTIVDRAKDIVIRGGENIYSIEVENILHAHPDVADAALVGVAHRVLGEEPVAVVLRRAGATVDERALQSWVAHRLAAFKVPVAVHFVDAPLPRNANGKLLKSELRAIVAVG